MSDIRALDDDIRTTNAPKTPMIIAAALALVLIVAVALVAVSFLRGSTPAAANGIPANALGIVEFNLNPATADQRALRDFVEKFPASRDEAGAFGDNYKQAIWRLLPLSEKAHYDTEVADWLGDSLAVGLVLPDGVHNVRDAEPIVSFETTDPVRAGRFASKYFPDGEHVLVDDLLVVSPHSTHILNAEAIKSAPLADGGAYRADMDKLGGSWLLTGWGSDALFHALAIGRHGEYGAEADDFEVHGAFGAKVAQGALTLRAVGFTDDELPHFDMEAGLVDDLPDSGIGALSMALPDQMIQRIWERTAGVRAEDPQAFSKLGLTSADDLRALLGNQLAITVGLDKSMKPALGLVVDTDDPARHEEILDLLAGTAGVALEHEIDDNIVRTTVGMSLDELANPARKLSDNKVFRQLTEGSAARNAVAWVDVPALLKVRGVKMLLEPDVTRNLEPISGIGMSVSTLDEHYTGLVVRVGTR